MDNSRTFRLANNYDPGLYANYKSVMNYNYTLTGPVDYSDGRNGVDAYGHADFNDWAAIDLTRIHNLWNVYEA